MDKRIHGYRGCTESFSILSEINQFNFDNNDRYLEIDLSSQYWFKPAPIERVNIYLDSNIIIKNAFIVNNSLFYYYEKEWYYEGHSELCPKPPTNILSRFRFNEDNIIRIQTNNKPIPTNKFGFNLKKMLLFPFIGWLVFPPSILDTKKSIENNIFLQLDRWEFLPKVDKNSLYVKK